MAAVSDYLALESARFEDRLKVRVDIPPAATQCPVPVMLVQTLVENAVKHGISKLREGGIVSVRAAVEGDNLILEVENPGTLRDSGGEGTQTGLANARERLRLLCGNQAMLSLAARNGAVLVKVVIPQQA